LGRIGEVNVCCPDTACRRSSVIARPSPSEALLGGGTCGAEQCIAVALQSPHEDLSEFVETAVVQAARRRKAQEEFLARGRASLAKAKRTGEFYSADKVLEDMRGRLLSRVQALRKSKAKSKTAAGAKR
jgi:hypothetical protein